MFKNLFNKINLSLTSHSENLSPEEKFFPNIVGYPDIKKLLLRSIVSKEPVHILLTGPPSSCKTVFLLAMLDNLDRTYFVDGVNSSGAGMVDYLFKNNTKYLLIDEIDKMKKNDQAALLNIMETGILSETKLTKKTRQKRMKLWILATSNESEKLSIALRSRFMELRLTEYTYEEFKEIVRKLLKKSYNIEDSISEKISNAVWCAMKSKDVRDAIRIAKLTTSVDDVDWLVNVQIRYGNRNAKYACHK